MAKEISLVGREKELQKIRACVQAHRNTLLEGPVGVGKTQLALAVTRELGRPVFRVDGDSRYSEQKLSGWFDPPAVIQKGYSQDSFVPGPLVEAMQKGGVLFINELNRLPEGVQNVLLPAIDERMILIPRLGEVRAKPDFMVIATQNPKEFVATSHLSEAILDRFELVSLDYQDEDEELKIVTDRGGDKDLPKLLPIAAVRLVRATRDHPRIRRGASIRAALSLTQIAQTLIKSKVPFEEAFLLAALMALPTRIEVEREADSEANARAEVDAVVDELAHKTLEDLQTGAGGVKKKPMR